MNEKLLPKFDSALEQTLIAESRICTLRRRYRSHHNLNSPAMIAIIPAMLQHGGSPIMTITATLADQLTRALPGDLNVSLSTDPTMLALWFGSLQIDRESRVEHNPFMEESRKFRRGYVGARLACYRLPVEAALEC